jgi:hypothetical protein
MAFRGGRLAAVVGAVVVVGVVSGAVPAHAAVSTPFKTVVAGGGACSINVGLAFDGKNLIVSCESDGRIDVVSSTTGALVSTHSPAGLSGPGAMAFDAAHNKLWICGRDETEVGWINMATWTYTKTFT